MPRASKPFVVGPPECSPTLEALRKERKNVPYVVVKGGLNNGTVVWERCDKGKVQCVHNSLYRKFIGHYDEENAVVSRALCINWEVFYCNKKEAFFVCL